MNEELAKKRFMIINLVRFSAMALIFAGAANLANKLLSEMTPTLGYLLLIIGAVDFFLAPVLLKRMWRSPDQ